MPLVKPAVPAAVTAERLTGDFMQSSVYRITIPGYERSYSVLPPEIVVPGYRVRGRDAAGTWTDVGRVVPVASPHIDRERQVVVYPEAIFYWENRPGGDQYAAFEIVGHRPIELADANQPPADLTQFPVTSLTAIGGTVVAGGDPAVEANGVAQEPVNIKMKANGATVNPDDDPALNRLYDYVYFRDQGGDLVTNLYRSRAEGGYTSISPMRGAYVNEMQMAQASSSSTYNRFYISTTRSTQTEVLAHLDVTAARTSSLLVVRSVAPRNGSVLGAATSGLTMAGGIKNPSDGAYHAFNGDQPAAALITRYDMAQALTSPPMRTVHYWHFLPNSEYAMLSSSAGIEPGMRFQSRFVTPGGTFVTAAEIPAFPAG
jgi:hypothetical protein